MKKALKSKVSICSLTMLGCFVFCSVVPSYSQPTDGRIDAAVNWTGNVGNDGKAFLFQGINYGRYDLKGTSYDPGYPRNTQNGWKLPSSWGGKVDAAINWGNGIAYLFRGTEYVKYPLNANKPEGAPRQTQPNWNLPPSWGGRVDAAINWGNGIAYLFFGDEYVRYPLNASQPEGGPKKTQPNWNLPPSWGGRVDAAINWGNGTAYLFYGDEYIRYPLNATKPEGGPKKTQPNWNLQPSESSTDEFKRFAEQFMQDNKGMVDALVGFALSLSSGQTKSYFSSGGFLKDVQAGNLSAVESMFAGSVTGFRNRQLSPPQVIFGTLTIGIVVDGGVFLGGNIETGIAINVTPEGVAAEHYRTFGVSAGLITGGSASIIVSLWRNLPQQIVGEARGLSFGAGKVVNPATGISVGGGLGFWFQPLQNSPGAIGFDLRQFAGLSASVGAGASLLPVDLRGTSALTQILNGGTWTADGCGALNQRPCHVVERYPSCNQGLKEDFIQHKCVQ